MSELYWGIFLGEPIARRWVDLFSNPINIHLYLYYKESTTKVRTTLYCTCLNVRTFVESICQHFFSWLFLVSDHNCRWCKTVSWFQINWFQKFAVPFIISSEFDNAYDISCFVKSVYSLTLEPGYSITV